MTPEIEDFRLLIPLNRRVRVNPIDRGLANIDIGYLAQLIVMANTAGLQGYKLDSVLATPKKKENGIQFEFKYEDRKES